MTPNFRTIEDVLYVDKDVVIELGITTEGYLWKINNKDKGGLKAITDPKNGKNILIQYESLSDEQKKTIQLRFNNPYDMVVRQPILDSVINRPAAYEFFMQYRYNDNISLPISIVNKYTRADAWLKFLGDVSLGDIKKGFGITVPSFYQHAGELIKTEIARGLDKNYTGIHMLPGDFPWAYQRLKQRADKYKNGSFEDIIDKRYGNKFASKIGKYEGGFCPEVEQQQMSVIRAIAAKHNNLDAAQVRELANVIFEKKGWEIIGQSRMYQLLDSMNVVLTPGKRGRKVYNNEIAMQNRRTAPKFPTYYFTVDGWTAELLYQNEKGYNNRLVVVVVLDPFNKYPVGYAIGERENTELIREANRNAILHLKELFGAYYKPYQMQSDRYSIKQLTPFYQAMGHLFTPAAVGNAKSKVIEPYFKYLNKKYCQLQTNWSGFNITAKQKNQVNAETLSVIKKGFPDKAGVEAQIERMIAQDRAKKVEQYKQKFYEMPDSDKEVINEMDWLMVFGLKMGNLNTIKGQGIVKTILGEKFVYDCFEPEFRNNMHLSWELRIDPYDTSKALASTPDGKLRFLLHDKMALPMDIKSTTAEHLEYRDKVRRFNQDQIDRIKQTYIDDAETVQEILEEMPLSLEDGNEAALKLMFTINGQQKEGIQNAKGLAKAKKAIEKQAQREKEIDDKNWREKQNDYRNSQTDISKYL